MNYSDYHISMQEFEEYLANNHSPKIDEIWMDMLNRIQDQHIKDEAKKKGYVLEDNPDIEDDVIADYKIVTVPDASTELKNYFEEKLYPYIVCMKE